MDLESVREVGVWLYRMEGNAHMVFGYIGTDPTLVTNHQTLAKPNSGQPLNKCAVFCSFCADWNCVACQQG